MGVRDFEAFLPMLATERRVYASPHNQALSAIFFLYREVLDIDLPWLNNIGRPQQTKRIPSVLTKEEIASLLHMAGTTALLARLLYGTGMRLMEGLRLRSKDVDFDRHAIVVREAKGNKDRVVILLHSLKSDLRRQLLSPRSQWQADRLAQRGRGELEMVLDVPLANVFCGPSQRRGVPPPFVRGAPATCLEKGGDAGEHRKVSVRAHLTPFVRDALARIGHCWRHNISTGFVVANLIAASMFRADDCFRPTRRN